MRTDLPLAEDETVFKIELKNPFKPDYIPPRFDPLLPPGVKRR